MRWRDANLYGEKLYRSECVRISMLERMRANTIQIHLLPFLLPDLQNPLSFRLPVILQKLSQPPLDLDLFHPGQDVSFDRIPLRTLNCSDEPIGVVPEDVVYVGSVKEA